MLAPVHKFHVYFVALWLLQRKRMQVTGWSAAGQVCCVKGQVEGYKDCPLRSINAADDWVGCKHTADGWWPIDPRCEGAPLIWTSACIPEVLSYQGLFSLLLFFKIIKSGNTPLLWRLAAQHVNQSKDASHSHYFHLHRCLPTEQLQPANSF